jgi:hypothetical protein
MFYLGLQLLLNFEEYDSNYVYTHIEEQKCTHGNIYGGGNGDGDDYTFGFKNGNGTGDGYGFANGYEEILVYKKLT